MYRNLIQRSRRYAPDGPPSGEPVKETPKPTGPAKPADPPGGEPTKPEKTFTQAELDAIVSDRIQREKDKSAKEAEKARKDAEEKSLADAKEFEKLAQQRADSITKLEARVQELEPVAARVAELEKLIKGHVDKEREGLPPHIVGLLDALPVEGQYKWLTDNGATLKAKVPAGVPPTPAGDPAGLSDVQRQAAQKRTANQYQSSY